jgi:uncharacterized protein YjbI with pentapeptide repeats
MKTSELNKTLGRHQLWIETGGVQGKFADLQDADLQDADLKDADLYRADLSHADLTHADLRGAMLRDANLRDANLTGAKLTGANLVNANLTPANLRDANLTNAILPDISWIIPGCLVQLNNFKYGFYLEKEDKLVNFVQDSFGFIIQNNGAEGTFDMLVEDQIIRNIPDWVKYSGLKKLDP